MEANTNYLIGISYSGLLSSDDSNVTTGGVSRFFSNFVWDLVEWDGKLGDIMTWKYKTNQTFPSVIQDGIWFLTFFTSSVQLGTFSIDFLEESTPLATCIPLLKFGASNLLFVFFMSIEWRQSELPTKQENCKLTSSVKLEQLFRLTSSCCLLSFIGSQNVVEMFFK